MERTDFIENRIDVVKNIYTLYSYAKSTVTEDKEWALQRFRQGRWYVVEPFGDTLLFAPSRFVGYKNNTREKHTIQAIPFSDSDIAKSQPVAMWNFNRS